MFGRAAQRSKGGDLYDRIGAFLADQGLSIDPAHYAFAHDVLANPGGDVAKAVAVLIEDGVRLSRRDIEKLGGSVVVAANRHHAPPDESVRLVADTHAQVDGFATMMRAMRDETRGFGEDLAQTAAAFTAPTGEPIAGIDEIARITGEMLRRVRDAEARLASATDETEALREKLAAATDDARRDTLTGLPNRRAFDEAFAGRSPERGPYCLAVCDIDRFKQINDAHGHGVGDRVLRAVAACLVEECAGHLVVRHGGEEFAILLSGLGLADAAGMLDGVRATVAGKRFRNRETDRPLGQITVSVGVTAVHADEASVDSFTRADRLLYTAKADGRDRVCAA